MVVTRTMEIVICVTAFENESTTPSIQQAAATDTC